MSLKRLYTSNGSGTTAKPIASSDEQVIYSGILSKKIFRLKLFSFGCSVATLVFQWKIWRKTDMDRIALIFVSSALAFFTFCTPLLIHFIAKKYCIQMLYNARKDVYTAKMYSFFMTKKAVTFTPADVKIPNVNRLFTIAFVKGYPLFFDAEEFTDLEHYKRIMGYDKPIDFQLGKH